MICEAAGFSFGHSLTWGRSPRGVMGGVWYCTYCSKPLLFRGIYETFNITRFNMDRWHWRHVLLQESNLPYALLSHLQLFKATAFAHSVCTVEIWGMQTLAWMHSFAYICRYTSYDQYLCVHIPNSYADVTCIGMDFLSQSGKRLACNSAGTFSYHAFRIR